MVWTGTGMGRWISGFVVPSDYELYGTEAREEKGKRIVSTNNCLWYTNIDHGKRHEPLQLMSMADNLKYNRTLIKRLNNKFGDSTKYPHYDNYDALEVPFTDAIPSDYDGVMAVPISFLDKYNPDQFELIGHEHDLNGDGGDGIPHGQFEVNGVGVFKRILIKKKAGVK